MIMMNWDKRRVGHTSLEVTMLGFGTATMGGSRIQVSREESEAMVRAAWDAGLRYVDTAPFYGVGSAERRVGDALRDKPRNEWVLSTKVGRLLKPRREQQPVTDGRLAPMPFTVVYDYGYDAIMRSVDDSYQRLGLDKIDILFVHDIGAYQHKDAAPGHMKLLRESGYKALTELKRSGVISAFGIGVNEKEVLLEAMGWGEWDVFLLAGRYTLLEQAPLDDLLPLCEQRGTSIVIGGPLNSGVLAGRDTWNYAPAPPDVVERVKRIQAVCDRHHVPLPAAALQFPLAHKAVCATIPGPRTVEEFRTNVELIRRKIPADLWAELKRENLLHPDAPVPA
jgi:D-threo-aldose 1-dehydrogenase